MIGLGTILGLTMAIPVGTDTGDQGVQVLQEWLSIFPVPECILSGNRSHFTATVVKDWAWREGIKWVFYTPYYPQANGIVEDVDNNDLDDNMVVNMMIEFAQRLNVTSVTVCLPILKSAEAPFLVFVQDINISVPLELTWKQYSNYSRYFKRLEGKGYTCL